MKNIAKNKELNSEKWSWKLFYFLLVVVNGLIWLPVLFIEYPTIGLGHDSQIFTAAIHAVLRTDNGFWSLAPKLLTAREDIFSFPYFGICLLYTSPSPRD